MFHHDLFCRRARLLVRLLCVLKDRSCDVSDSSPDFERAPDTFRSRFRASFTPDLPTRKRRLDDLIEDA